MDRGMNKIIIVTKKTRLEELIKKYNTKEQARFYIEHLGADFSDYILEDRIYNNAVKELTNTAQKYARIQIIDRDFLPNMIFGDKDVIIAIGQDGLVANTMKYLDGQALIGVNPDVSRYDGILLPFETEQMNEVIPKVLSDRYSVNEVTMACASTMDGRSILAVNDLFIGPKSHTSARYDLNYNDVVENQSSSGIIVSTGLGSTGWYKSVMAQTSVIAGYYHSSGIETRKMAWDANELVFVVMEPFPSKFTQASIVYGYLHTNDKFDIISKMPDNGVVFSDGIEQDFIEFSSGVQIHVGIADKKGRLVA